MSDNEVQMNRQSTGATEALRVVVVGGGIAGAEAMLALRDLAGGRVALTLVSPATELVLPALTVAEPFALGHAQRYRLDDLLVRVEAELIPGSLAAVDEPRREIRLDDGTVLSFDVLVIATGARPVARLEQATTWWPGADSEDFSGLLRDMEEGYTKRVAFVIPPGPVWPLPLYEIAMMTAREVAGMGIDGAELTVITPEATPLALFGSQASAAVRDELRVAGIHLETATLIRVERGHPIQVVLQPTVRRLEVDRVVALPGIVGPAIPGTTQDAAGFILVGQHGQMRGSEAVWAAGDAIAYPVKFGGLATQQADAVAANIATRAGVETCPGVPGLKLQGVLMTGAAPRPLGAVASTSPSAHRPMWRPTGKVFGKHLTGFLEELESSPRNEDDLSGVVIEETLPDPGSDQADIPCSLGT
jgi:sulfide:quinone oxidoreductase